MRVGGGGGGGGGGDSMSDMRYMNAIKDMDSHMQI
jgi:hypothetical protein